MKITKEELESIELWDITFYTYDKKGKKKFWKTKNNFDHSDLCEDLEVDDLVYNGRFNNIVDFASERG